MFLVPTNVPSPKYIVYNDCAQWLAWTEVPHQVLQLLVLLPFLLVEVLWFHCYLSYYHYFHYSLTLIFFWVLSATPNSSKLDAFVGGHSYLANGFYVPYLIHVIIHMWAMGEGLRTRDVCLSGVGWSGVAIGIFHANPYKGKEVEDYQ